MSQQIKPIRECGTGKLYHIKGLRVLQLYGTEEEMAYQHGVLLKEDIQKGVIRYLANKLEFEAKNEGPLKKHPWLQKLVLTYVNQVVFRNLIRHIPEEYKKVINVLSKTTGISSSDILKAASMPDAMVILSSLVSKPFINTQTFGCTSFVTFDEMTQTGELMHGRNLDFPVANFWDRYSTIAYCSPKFGQKYCAITTAGILLPGVTGFNESGLILGIHQLFTYETSSHGVPIVFIGSEVIKKAKTIEEAITIVKNMKRAGNWGMVISSFKEKKAVVIETSPKEIFVREAKNGFIAESNYCFSPSIKKREIFFNWTTSEDNFYRHDRLVKECFRLKGQMEEAKGISLLGDHFDPLLKKTKGLGRVISTIYNVQSAFFRPEKKKFWVSTGLAPSNLTTFLELPFEWSASLLWEEKEISANDFSNTTQGKAMKEYTRAYYYFSNEKDFQKTLYHIQKAIDLDPLEFSYHLAKGFMLLKLERFSEALKAFEEASQAEMTLHEKALIALYKGRTYDLLSNRKMAQECYKPYINASLDKKIQKVFKKSWDKPFQKKDIDKNIFQFIFADFLAY